MAKILTLHLQQLVSVHVDVSIFLQCISDFTKADVLVELCLVVQSHTDCDIRKFEQFRETQLLTKLEKLSLQLVDCYAVKHVSHLFLKLVSSSSKSIKHFNVAFRACYFLKNFFSNLENLLNNCLPSKDEKIDLVMRFTLKKFQITSAEETIYVTKIITIFNKILEILETRCGHFQISFNFPLTSGELCIFENALLSEKYCVIYGEKKKRYFFLLKSKNWHFVENTDCKWKVNCENCFVNNFF